MKRDSLGNNASDKASRNVSAKEPTDRYVVPALQRGLQLLGEFKRSDRELTGAELSRRITCRAPPSSACCRRWS